MLVESVDLLRMFYLITHLAWLFLQGFSVSVCLSLSLFFFFSLSHSLIKSFSSPLPLPCISSLLILWDLFFCCKMSLGLPASTDGRMKAEQRRVRQ